MDDLARARAEYAKLKELPLPSMDELIAGCASDPVNAAKMMHKMMNQITQAATVIMQLAARIKELETKKDQWS